MPIRGSASLCEVRPLYKSPRRPKFMDQFPFVIASCTYRDSSLTSEWPLNGNRLPPRVRTKVPSVNTVVGLINRVHDGAMLKVLICERWSAGPTRMPSGPRPPLSTTSPDHAVAFWASKELGVWNQERVNPRFTWMESRLES